MATDSKWPRIGLSMLFIWEFLGPYMEKKRSLPSYLEPRDPVNTPSVSVASVTALIRCFRLPFMLLAWWLYRELSAGLRSDCSPDAQDYSDRTCGLLLSVTVCLSLIRSFSATSLQHPAKQLLLDFFQHQVSQHKVPMSSHLILEESGS